MQHPLKRTEAEPASADVTVVQGEGLRSGTRRGLAAAYGPPAVVPTNAEQLHGPMREPRFERIRQLGVGGMGEVTLVLDRDIGRLVAIKRLLPNLDDKTTLRFANEIRTLGRIEHPNIVPIHDVGIGGDGRFFFVMKYIEGETLSAVLEGLRENDLGYHRRYPLERRVAIFIDVLRALSAAHAHGVLHRDIKPSNIMVGTDGAVVVLDWGIAKDLHDGGTEQGSLLGTLPYMSPEQAWGRNDQLDERSDLYSATVLFHELITGSHYVGPKPSAETTLLAVISSEVSFASLAAARPKDTAVPLSLYRIIARGLAKNPAERYPSADDMIAELTSVLQAQTAFTRWAPSFAGTLRGLRLALLARMHLLYVTATAFASRLRPARAS